MHRPNDDSHDSLTDDFCLQDDALYPGDLSSLHFLHSIQ